MMRLTTSRGSEEIKSTVNIQYFMLDFLLTHLVFTALDLIKRVMLTPAMLQSGAECLCHMTNVANLCSGMLHGFCFFARRVQTLQWELKVLTGSKVTTNTRIHNKTTFTRDRTSTNR